MRTIFRNKLTPVALCAIVALGVAGLNSAWADSPSTSKKAGAHAAKRCKCKRGPRGRRGPRGFRGATGPRGVPGSAGQGTPLLFRAPANTANTVLFTQNGLQIEGSCSAAKVTTLQARSQADHGVIRAINVRTGGTSKSDDFNNNQTLTLTPGAAADNYVLTFLSASGRNITSNYATANNGGGGAGTNTIADCLAFGTISAP